MLGEVAGHLGAAHTEPDQDDVAHVQGLQQRGQVPGQRVIGVGMLGLGLPEAAAVIGNHAVAGTSATASC